MNYRATKRIKSFIVSNSNKIVLTGINKFFLVALSLSLCLIVYSHYFNLIRIRRDKPKKVRVITNGKS